MRESLWKAFDAAVCVSDISGIMRRANNYSPAVPSPRRKARGGFTLTETALAMVIVGTGFMGGMELFAACAVQNHSATQGTTARMLGDNIREAMAGLSFVDPTSTASNWGPEAGESLAGYDDVDDFDGLTFNPPIDAQRAPVTQLSRYTQKISVMPVSPDEPCGNLNEAAPTLPKGAYTGAVRVRVKVLYQAPGTTKPEEVYSTSWIRADN